LALWSSDAPTQTLLTKACFNHHRTAIRRQSEPDPGGQERPRGQGLTNPIAAGRPTLRPRLAGGDERWSGSGTARFVGDQELCAQPGVRPRGHHNQLQPEGKRTQPALLSRLKEPGEIDRRLQNAVALGLTRRRYFPSFLRRGRVPLNSVVGVGGLFVAALRVSLRLPRFAGSCCVVRVRPHLEFGRLGLAFGRSQIPCVEILRIVAGGV